MFLVALFVLPNTLQASTTHATPDFLSQAALFEQEEQQQGIHSILEKITYRATEVPFLLVASIIFLLAILHTFFAIGITQKSHRINKLYEIRVRRAFAKTNTPVSERDIVSFKGTMLHFLGEIEVIFGLWAAVLFIAMVSFYDMDTAKQYISQVNFTEPMFVVVIMALASTRPVLRFAENALSFAARLGGQTPASWWLSILIIAPILGSFITEPGAMTIAAMLLAKKFYKLHPSTLLSYATLGLLFVNVSAGGVLTHFAAPPVLMVASPEKWDLTTSEMFFHFGIKAIVGISLSTLLYFLIFKKELSALAKKLHDSDGDGSGDLAGDHSRPIPTWIIITHLLFMAWTVFCSHNPALFIGGFLFFLAFREATALHQDRVHLRGPVLVGFFLAGLVIHGGLQGWWLSPILTSLTEIPLFVGSVVLTSFNDNAAITFLASQVDGLGNSLKYAVLAGAVCGGGLTLIANAPNPAGQSLLNRFFGKGIAPSKLFLSALIPTIIVSLAVMFIPDPHKHTIFEKENTSHLENVHRSH